MSPVGRLQPVDKLGVSSSCTERPGDLSRGDACLIFVLSPWAGFWTYRAILSFIPLPSAKTRLRRLHRAPRQLHPFVVRVLPIQGRDQPATTLRRARRVNMKTKMLRARAVQRGRFTRTQSPTVLLFPRPPPLLDVVALGCSSICGVVCTIPVSDHAPVSQAIILRVSVGIPEDKKTRTVALAMTVTYRTVISGYRPLV